jgi:hypothetical protein
MMEATHDAQEMPIACNLTGAELAERGDEVSTLFHEAEQVRELEDGYAFRFPGSDDHATRLLAFTLAERRCCPFFTFELTFEPNEQVWLRLRGSAAIKEFVASAWAEAIAAHA